MLNEKARDPALDHEIREAAAELNSVDQAVAVGIDGLSWPGAPGRPGPLLDARNGFVFAVTLVVAAAVLRATFPAILVQRAPLVPFFAAVLLSVWFGGRGPGIVALTLSSLATGMFFASASTPARVPYPTALLAVLVFAITNGCIVAVVDALQRAKMRADEAGQTNVAILESISDAFVRLDRQWRVEYANQAAERLGRTGRDQMLGQDIRELFPGAEPVRLVLSDAMENGTSVSAFIFYYARLGVWAEINAYPTPGGLSVFIRDITDRKQAEDERNRYVHQIEELNQRLQRAMGETHHRIKNSLQVITALVDLQSHRSEGNVSASDLQRLTQHVKGLAAIHDLLTLQSKETPLSTEISIHAALANLISTMQPMLADREIALHADPASLPVRLATGLTVLVNELLLNAIKHGRGGVFLTFTVAGDRGRLQIEDEGPGFPPDFDPVTSQNTGMELITSLAQWDLAGSVVYGNRPEGGACVTVEFPLVFAAAVREQEEFLSRS